jgi:hypothetical protein
MTMADEIDKAQELEEMHREHALLNRPRYVMQQGKPGDCDLCGEFFSRLVDGACGHCRDRYKLP